MPSGGSIHRISSLGFFSGLLLEFLELTGKIPNNGPST